MAGSADDFLNLALQNKRAAEEAVARREQAGRDAVEKAAAARAKAENDVLDMWDTVKAQIDAQVDAINAKSAVLEVVAEIEERFVIGPVLGARAIHFNRKVGFGRISMLIQLNKGGVIQYFFDKKTVFSGKITQMKPKDHETIMSKILAVVVANLAKGMARPQPSEGSRAQVWQAAKA